MATFTTEQLVFVYQGNPTAGGTDGVEVSNLTMTAPLKAKLQAEKAQSKVFKVAIRCKTGYRTLEDVTISFSGTTAGHWSVCADNNFMNEQQAQESGTWASSLVIPESTIIRNTNYVFWIKADSSTDEESYKDNSVKLFVDGIVVNEEDYNAYLEELAEDNETKD